MGAVEGIRWIADNWVTLLNAVGVVGGLFFTATAVRSATKTQRIANLLALTSNHREVWREFFSNPELARVLDETADISKAPVTPGEQEFVNMVVLHVSSAYESLKDELMIKQDGLGRDMRSFFSLPIPRAVWAKTKEFQNDDFVNFVDSFQNSGQRPTSSDAM
jgi:hypothetical protein